MRLLAIVTVAVIVAATVVASLGYGDQAFAFLRHVPGGDLTGHFGLYAALSFAICGLVSRPTPAATRAKRLRVVSALAVLVTLEELSQALLPSRTFSLLDLAASLTGLAAGLLATVLACARPPRSGGWQDSDHGTGQTDGERRLPRTDR